MKKILLAAVVAAFTFSGCSQLFDSKPAKEETVKSTSKAVKSTSKAVKVTEKVTKSTDEATKESAEASLPQSSMKDQVVEEAVEVADEKTDGAATKVIESVK